MKKPAQRVLKFEAKSRAKPALDFLLYQPPGDPPKNGWPLLLFLHGSGERGSNIRRVLKHGPPQRVEAGHDFSFVIASPQCPAKKWWTADLLEPFLDHLLGKFSLDRSRVYLTGISMGGFGTWDFAMACPERFAAIIPICGGGEALPILLAQGQALEALKKLPIWAFHGAKDELVPLSETERMVTAFRSIGNEPRLTIYPEAAHDSWTETYANPDLYNWLLQHRTRNPGIPIGSGTR